MTARQYQILQALCARPDFALGVAELTGLALGITQGALRKLCDLGLVMVVRQGGRRVFWLTPAGVRAARLPRRLTWGERLQAWLGYSGEAA